MTKRDMEIERVPVTPFRQNCSLVWCPETRRGIVVDPGGDAEHVLERVAAADVVIEAILLTHGHLDHVGGARRLRELLTERQGGQSVQLIGPTPADDFLMDSVEKQAAAFGIDGLQNVRPDVHTQDGETLKLAGRTYEVLHVPGHTPGHVVFFDPRDRVLFAGDTLFRGTIGRTDFPYGNADTLISAIREKIIPLGDDVIVLPGHGAPTTVGAEKRENPFLQS